MKKIGILLAAIMVIAGIAVVQAIGSPLMDNPVQLCYKEAPDWQCIEPVDSECIQYESESYYESKLYYGTMYKFKRYRDVCTEFATDIAVPDATVTYNKMNGDLLKLCVNAVGLDDIKYQVGLNGEKTTNGCTLTSGDYKAYVNNVLSTSGSNGYESGCWNNEEGWYNFAMAQETVDGVLDKCYYITLPEGPYQNLKVLIKKDGQANGDNDYQAVLMEETEKDLLSFNIGITKYEPSTCEALLDLRQDWFEGSVSMTEMSNGIGFLKDNHATEFDRYDAESDACEPVVKAKVCTKIGWTTFCR